MFKSNIQRLIGRIVRRQKEHPYFDAVQTGGFGALYSALQRATGTKPSVWRRDRFYNLRAALEFTRGGEGSVAECGVYRGLSSLITLDALAKEGNRSAYYAIDFFEGLSAPTAADALPSSYAGMLSASLDEVRRNLVAYPDVTFLKGWIPDVLHRLPDVVWRLVHVDVDLIEPTLAVFDYFYPRLASRGIIVCDDYASVHFPKLKSAVDAHIQIRGWNALRLSTGQIFILNT